MAQVFGKNNNKVYKVVLTGGPCGGKTTGQIRLCTFFENLGWKVYRAPETALVLMSGGVKWTSLTQEEAYLFQANLLRSMIQIENTLFELASTCPTNCLVICDRGTMDASAYLKPGEWERMKEENDWNEVDLRDSRYNQVIHMVSSANGAEMFYHTAGHETRHENLQLARSLDAITSQSWVGHPYYDVIDNSTDFERKIVRMIATVCNRLGIEAGDRLSLDSKKRKFLVRTLPDELEMFNRSSSSSSNDGSGEEGESPAANMYPQFQDFIVVHDYLATSSQRSQARIRRRGQNVKWNPSTGQWNLETVPRELQYHLSRVSLNGECQDRDPPLFIYGTDMDFSHWTYTHTIRRPTQTKESPEIKMMISSKEYEVLRAQRDTHRHTVFKKRRCFLWNNTYFQMDIYQEPCHDRCRGLILLETYTTHHGDDLQLPDFLDVVCEVTKDSYYSMYNLSRKDCSAEELKKHNQAKHAQLANAAAEEMALEATSKGIEATTNGVELKQLKGVEAKLKGVEATTNGVEATTNGIELKPLKGVEAKLKGIEAKNQLNGDVVLNGHA